MSVLFALLGRAVSRGWPWFLGAWVLMFALVSWAAPPWRAIAEDREFGFLPASSPSRRGEALFQKAFADEFKGSNVVFVLHRSGEKLTGQDYQFVDKVLKPGLERIAEQEGGLDDLRAPNRPAEEKRSTIWKISSARDPGSGALLISPDHQATLMVVELTTEFMELRNRATLSQFENLLEQARHEEKVPAGLTISLTGSATVGRDINEGQIQSARATEIWTVVLVVGLLLLIYRAPLVALVPLVTVFCALQVSIKLLSLLAETGVVTLFEGIQIYLTIILYGAGVDYCLFLIGRYREDLDAGQTPAAALSSAIAKVGVSLTASAATVMFGIGMMAFADFGKFHFAGLAIAFSLFVDLCAVLTLGAALLGLAGRWAFWPNLPKVDDGHASAKTMAAPPVAKHLFWDRLAALLARRPGIIWLASVALLTPFVIVAARNGNHVNYDLLDRLPAHAPSRIGTKALQAHFSSGATGPVTMVFYNPRLDFRADENQDSIKKLQDRLLGIRQELGLTDILSSATPLGITKAGKVDTVDLTLPFPPETIQIQPGAPLFGSSWGMSFGFDLGENYHREAFLRKKGLEHFVSSSGPLKGQVTQMVLLLEMNPLSREGTERLREVEKNIWQEMPAELRGDSEIYFIGPTAEIRDLIDVTGADETRIRYLVTGCVFLILLLLLRRFLVSVYLIASVLFSFFATLGATYAFFWALAPPGFPGLDWKVSVLLFTVLVAIGEDYNIFLMTRINEEQQRLRDAEQGVQHALIKTGHIITSCGLIMAGTFASLLAGSLVDLQHLGFALALGVLLDTFLVRPILVPTFLLLLQRFKSSLLKKSTIAVSRGD